MNPTDRRLMIDLTTARYLHALERDDFSMMEEVWRLALADPELEAALREVHAGLIEEADRAAAGALTAAVETHLPSAEIIRTVAGPVTVADVADELFRHTPDRLPAEAHLLNERLRASRESLPADLGLSKLTAWAEAKFGQAAVKLELRRAAEAEYHLAARPAPKPEDKP
jgi:hypothetical protein